MPSSALHDAALALAWSQWAALGLSAWPSAAPEVVIDPEELLLLTFEVGREDPRLFDEALDWLHHNHRLISTNRLLQLCADDLDARLANAAIDWLGAHGRGARRARSAPTGAQQGDERALVLFPGDDPPAAHADPSYAVHGILRRRVEPSGKSQSPDLMAPACLALRVRAILGLGAKAEVLTQLLSAAAPRTDAAELIAGAGFSAPRVREALADLTQAGVITEARVGRAASYAADRQAWATVLGAPMAQHVPWVALLGAVRRLLRFTREAETAFANDYLRSSAARTLWDEVQPQLLLAGVRLRAVPFSPSEAFLAEFDGYLEALAGHLRGFTAASVGAR